MKKIQTYAEDGLVTYLQRCQPILWVCNNLAEWCYSLGLRVKGKHRVLFFMSVCVCLYSIQLYELANAVVVCLKKLILFSLALNLETQIIINRLVKVCCNKQTCEHGIRFMDCFHHLNYDLPTLWFCCQNKLFFSVNGQDSVSDSCHPTSIRFLQHLASCRFLLWEMSACHLNFNIHRFLTWTESYRVWIKKILSSRDFYTR